MAFRRTQAPPVSPNLVILTNSSRSLYRNCQEAFNLAYEQKLEVKVPRPFQSIGAIMGVAFQDMLLRKDMGDVVAAMRLAVSKERRLYIGNPDPFEKAVSILEGMVLGWNDNRGILEDAEVVHIGGRPMLEMPFEIDMDRDLILKGAIDGLVRKPNGLWLVENKALSRIDEALTKKIPMLSQLTTYLFGMKLVLPPNYAKQIKGVIYNVIGKTAIRQKQGESVIQFQERVLAEYQSEDPEERAKYYFQKSVQRSEREMATFVERLHNTADDIRKSRKTGIWDQNEQFCTHFAGCQFLDICTKGKVPQVMSKYQVREFLHQEVDMEE